MKNKTLKIFAILLFAAAICVTGITLSQNNEYKKFLELNKKALAEEGKKYSFGGGLNGYCSNFGYTCFFVCSFCDYESPKVSVGTAIEVHGTCPGCGHLY